MLSWGSPPPPGHELLRGKTSRWLNMDVLKQAQCDGLTHKLSSSQKSNQINSALLSSCPVAALRLHITPVIFSTFPFQWRVILQSQYYSRCEVWDAENITDASKVNGKSGPHGLPGCPGASTHGFGPRPQGAQLTAIPPLCLCVCFLRDGTGMSS